MTEDEAFESIRHDVAGVLCEHGMVYEDAVIQAAAMCDAMSMGDARWVVGFDDSAHAPKEVRKAGPGRWSVSVMAPDGRRLRKTVGGSRSDAMEAADRLAQAR